MSKPQRKALALLLVISATGPLLQCFPDINAALGYHRQAVIDGQWWRLLTASLAHANITQALYTALGGLLAWVILYDVASPFRFAVMTFTAAISVGAGIHWLVPDITQYYGLSGVLYGFAGGGLLLVLAARLWSNALLIATLLTLKLGWDIYANGGALLAPGEGEFRVAIESHLLGTLGGVLGALLTVLATTAVHRCARSSASV